MQGCEWKLLGFHWSNGLSRHFWPLDHWSWRCLQGCLYRSGLMTAASSFVIVASIAFPPFTIIVGHYFSSTFRTSALSTTTNSPIACNNYFLIFFPWFGRKLFHRLLPLLAVSHDMKTHQHVAAITSSFLILLHVGSMNHSSLYELSKFCHFS